MLGLKLNHVSTRGSWSALNLELNYYGNQCPWCLHESHKAFGCYWNKAATQWSLFKSFKDIIRLCCKKHSRKIGVLHTNLSIGWSQLKSEMLFECSVYRPNVSTCFYPENKSNYFIRLISNTVVTRQYRGKWYAKPWYLLLCSLGYISLKNWKKTKRLMPFLKYAFHDKQYYQNVKFDYNI